MAGFAWSNKLFKFHKEEEEEETKKKKKKKKKRNEALKLYFFILFVILVCCFTHVQYSRPDSSGQNLESDGV